MKMEFTLSPDQAFFIMASTIVQEPSTIPAYVHFLCFKVIMFGDFNPYFLFGRVCKYYLCNFKISCYMLQVGLLSLFANCRVRSHIDFHSEKEESACFCFALRSFTEGVAISLFLTSSYSSLLYSFCSICPIPLIDAGKNLVA